MKQRLFLTEDTTRQLAGRLPQSPHRENCNLIASNLIASNLIASNLIARTLAVVMLVTAIGSSPLAAQSDVSNKRPAAPIKNVQFTSASTKLSQARQLQATPVSDIKVLPGFKVELLYSVRNDDQGSWVSLTHDPQGRLLASDQYGKLFRITPPAESGDEIKVEQIQADIGMAQGLLYAFDSLYVVVNGNAERKSGLYRLRDNNGDDQFDEVKLLRNFDGSGEHGPHAVILGPDRKSLYICGGNHTKIPDPEKSLVPRNWDEDQLLPRMWDAGGHAVGRLAPGGWICRTSPNGAEFELVSSGYRNEYDIAFNTAGELFTYDADMEWDVGLPWYRPTRVLHATSGSEFGWRSGTGKWPSYYPDSLPSVLDIGPGSPTGIVFGTGARFPEAYQRALFIADWSYGIIYAVHLKPEGATYTATREPLVSAAALQVSDMTVNPHDGALYFTIGGRRTQSGLYRVTYVGDAPTDASPPETLTPLQNMRRGIETLHEDTGGSAVVAAWPFLAHEDRHIRYAARIAIEHQPVDLWVNRISTEKDLRTIVEAVIALARNGRPEHQAIAISALDRVPWSLLDDEQRLGLLRAYGLVLIRLGPATPDTSATIISKLDPYYPSGSVSIDRELARLMISQQSPTAAAKTIRLLRSAKTQEEQIDYALSLRSLRTGWSLDHLRAYFAWFNQAASLRGGHSFGGFLNNIREEAIANLNDQQRTVLKAVLNAKPVALPTDIELKSRTFVNKWTVDELLPLVENDSVERDLERGQHLFAVAQCYKCHRFNGSGGIVGPDLTAAGRRFNTHDLLASIVDPSKVISDQYEATMFLTSDGRQFVGRVVNMSGSEYRVQKDMLDPGNLTSIKVADIDEMAPADVSMMPEGLLDTFTEDEILDLVAFARSGEVPSIENQVQPEEPEKSTSLNDAEPQSKLPNVVLLISDDQTWTDYGFMGHPVIETPNLDLLASQSALFTRGYVPTSLCRPSLATIISGLYAHQHRISGNDPAVPAGGNSRSLLTDPEYLAQRNRLIDHVDSIPLLPKSLADKGYLSFQTGKWWEGNYRRGGFSEGMTHGDMQRGGRHGDDGLLIGRKGLKPIFDFIDWAGDKPFFVWYAPFLPHTPHTPPKRLLEKYSADGRPEALAKYYAMCHWFDETCGQLVDGIDRRGLGRDTLFIYVTDNGWIQRTPQTEVPDQWNQSFAPKSKQSPYDGGVRTPIMLRWSGTIKPMRDSETLVSSIDIAPTVLAACELSADPRMRGVNLLPLCNGHPLDRDTIFGEGFAHDVADINDPLKSLLYRWCIEGDWKLLLSYPGQMGRYRAAHLPSDGKPQLYQLKDDPLETKNVAEEHPEIVARLTEKIANWYPLN